MTASRRTGPHVLVVDEGRTATDHAEVFTAARAAGRRVGWLDLAELPAPEPLQAAADLGALRAVAVGAGGSVSVKPRKGEPILRDLLREHFVGADLVLIRGGAEAVARLVGDGACRLVQASGRWAVERAVGDPIALGAEALVARLGRPRPWG